jgi:hypothetical protein
MPYPGFIQKSGPYELGTSSPTVASTLIDAADALEEDSGQLSPAASAEFIVGVALQTKLAANATTDAIQVLYCYSQRTKFWANAEAGTFVAADIHTSVDLNSADGVAANTTTNGDFYVVGFTLANTGFGVFAKPASIDIG